MLFLKILFSSQNLRTSFSVLRLVLFSVFISFIQHLSCDARNKFANEIFQKFFQLGLMPIERCWIYSNIFWQKINVFKIKQPREFPGLFVDLIFFVFPSVLFYPALISPSALFWLLIWRRPILRPAGHRFFPF